MITRREKMLLLLPKGQKDFKFMFSPDEQVEVTDLESKGSRGYVSCIKVDRNGVFYEVILTGSNKNSFSTSQGNTT